MNGGLQQENFSYKRLHQAAEIPQLVRRGVYYFDLISSILAFNDIMQHV